MRIEYDPVRGLLYISFASTDVKAAKTETIAPGVFADFDVGGRLIGIEVLDASEVLGERLEFGVKLEAITRSAA